MAASSTTERLCGHVQLNRLWLGMNRLENATIKIMTVVGNVARKTKLKN
jgi:hypothetical protein